MPDDTEPTNEAQPAGIDKELADIQAIALSLQQERDNLSKALVEEKDRSAGILEELVSARAEIHRLEAAQPPEMEEISRLYAALGVDPTEPIDAIRDRLHALGVPGY